MHLRGDLPIPLSFLLALLLPLLFPHSVKGAANPKNHGAIVARSMFDVLVLSE
jgi:hypothetical protein